MLISSLFHRILNLLEYAFWVLLAIVLSPFVLAVFLWAHWSAMRRKQIIEYDFNGDVSEYERAKWKGTI